MASYACISKLDTATMPCKEYIIGRLKQYTAAIANLG